ncbi:hypothetical protein EK21DRAFT_104171 [Setomelanomma holmii]|uniref:SH3 domain-containing protein n=1 Tax=Setomelanomma holmii TaxID=210430 RepID=A0A9P4LG28_9PLEO|nr:hypothetical protein EK21DRAFT_104171 [Setomelanomma holmii]
MLTLIDTLDLQDKSSPTAQDHSQQPERPAPLGIGPAAPHQQASLRQVEEERTSEEVRLQNAWSNAGTHLREDPGSDDERTVVNTNGQQNSQQDETAIRLNGGISGDGDDSDMQDGDVEEDMDDDMMDKISSSPSIDDGGYSFPLQPPTWPQRRESLTPNSSPMCSVASSSPFTTTPIHFPICVASARRRFDVPAPDSTPVSPSRSSPIPFSYRSPQKNDSKSAEHHRGEYVWTPTTGLDSDSDSGMDTTMSPRSKQRKAVELRLRFAREDSQASVVSDFDEDQASSMLRPMQPPGSNSPDDAMPVSPPRTTNGTPPPRVKTPDEDDSWTTDSDADTWDETMDNDDVSNDVSFSDDPRFVDSGWGGECLRETEDIDFEFVYALHTFVATVEGQANATKGDTMVLLDDSNSYWWLVRVVKDSSIGYLPAEHIETPTERLARLNKHRNIDLSATMLGDTAEKSKNPLKKAMRRRNAKTVQFAPPTYVEASDYDYSSDEGDGELFGGPAPKQVLEQQQQEAQKAEPEQEKGLEVQPLKLGGAKKDAKSDGDARASGEDARKEDEKQRASDDVDRPLDPKVSKNGTLRNTDSFFKDENTETRKITLTPNLLRDDSSTSTTGSRERGPSLESLEKNGFADKVKDDKKKKEKKSGMLSGLFKRKDKKAKGQLDSQDSDIEIRPDEADRSSPQLKRSEESSERPSAEQLAPQRQASKGKLQKSQRSRDDSPQKMKGILKTDSPTEATSDSIDGKPGQQQSSTMRLVPTEQIDSGRPSVEERPSNTMSSNNPFSKSYQKSEPKPEQVKRAKQRVQLDDFDTSDEDSDPFADPDAQTKPTQTESSEPTGRLSESPVHVTAADAQPSNKAPMQESEREPDPQHPPGLTQDNSSQETSSPVSTPTPEDSPLKTVPENSTLSTFRSENSSSPTHLSPTTAATIPPPSRPAPVSAKADREAQPSPPVSSESTQLPAWSDAALRVYLDDGSDVRDMLLVVNDTTGVMPVGRDHPIMRTLYVEESKTIQGMSSELDRLLNGLMEKRMKRNGSAASKASTTRSGTSAMSALR